MSIRKIIHDAIVGELNREVDDVKVYDLKWIDMWKAQFGAKDDKEKQYPYNFPAAFISVKNIAWIDEVIDNKTGTVTIDVWLVFNKFGDTFEGATDKDDSFAIIDLVESIADGLHWIEDSPFKELTQISEEDLTERYERPVYKLTFQTIVYKQVNQ